MSLTYNDTTHNYTESRQSTSTTETGQRKRHEIRPLTGLRGIAACSVMVYHFQAGDVCCTTANPLSNMLLHGYLAVDLFFVLSGFTLAMVYSETMLGRFNGRTYGDFLMRRIARVWPLLAVAVMAGLAINLAKHTPLPHPGWTVAGDLAMLDGWNLVLSLGGPTWSVSTEWAAYLIFPALLFLTMRSRPRWAIIFGAAAFAPLLWLAFTFSGVTPERHGILDIYYLHGAMPLLRCFAGFTLGLLAFRASRVSWVMRAAHNDTPGLLVAGATLAALCVPRTDLLIELLFPALVIAAYAETTPLARFLGSPLPYLLGVWSYSIYLAHKNFIGAEMHLSRLLVARIGPAGHAFALVVAYAAAIGLASVLYATVETKGRKVLTSFSWMKPRRSFARDTGGAFGADPAVVILDR